MTIKEIFKIQTSGETQEARGWIKTVRKSKSVSFIMLYDGSTFEPLQVVVDNSLGLDLSKCLTGTSIRVSGQIVDSKGKEQKYDLEAKSIEIIGECSDAYPIQAKKHSLEFFREHVHLRTRTSLFQAVFRIRHSLKMLTFGFFGAEGFIHIDTPIITGSDCEGAGEMFKLQGDFFDQEVGLTVSGQLDAETAMMGLGKVFTFGPTFRAEKSNTSRHLSEFWMMEPEAAFCDLPSIMFLAETYLRLVLSELTRTCSKELEYLQAYIQKEEKGLKKEDRSMPLIEKLESVYRDEFVRVSYTDAYEILKKSKPAKKGKFEYPVEDWGMDLKSEHERYLVEKHFKKPVIIFDYPKESKAFYMRDQDDGKTVAAMDILFPGIGEIVGGSQREERLDVLEKKMDDFGIDKKEMSQYLDTRRFGSVPHSGFGLGFERLVQFATGMKNIRDVILYPRTPGSVK